VIQKAEPLPPRAQRLFRSATPAYFLQQKARQRFNLPATSPARLLLLLTSSSPRLLTRLRPSMAYAAVGSRCPPLPPGVLPAAAGGSGLAGTSLRPQAVIVRTRPHVPSVRHVFVSAAWRRRQCGLRYGRPSLPPAVPTLPRQNLRSSRHTFRGRVVLDAGSAFPGPRPKGDTHCRSPFGIPLG